VTTFNYVPCPRGYFAYATFMSPVHMAKQWTPVDFMVYVAEGVTL